MSGRGLGFTGGTLDKLESIPGFRTSMQLAEFVDVLKRVGVAIIATTSEFAPVRELALFVYLPLFHFHVQLK